MTREELIQILFGSTEIPYPLEVLKDKYKKLYEKFLNTAPGTNDEEAVHEKVLQFRLLLNKFGVSDFDITELTKNVLFSHFVADTFTNKKFKEVDENCSRRINDEEEHSNE